MTILDRFNIGLVGAVAGLCGVAMAASPVAAAAPFATGGYECVAPAAGGTAPAAGAAVCAPVADMAGVPMGLPGPPPPIAPPPVVPPIAPPPIVPPLAPPCPSSRPSFRLPHHWHPRSAAWADLAATAARAT